MMLKLTVTEKSFPTQSVLNVLHNTNATRVARFFLVKQTKIGKIAIKDSKMATKQMAMKYTKFFHPQALQNC
jgi:hypothetical protein